MAPPTVTCMHVGGAQGVGYRGQDPAGKKRLAAAARQAVQKAVKQCSRARPHLNAGAHVVVDHKAHIWLVYAHACNPDRLCASHLRAPQRTNSPLYAQSLCAMMACLDGVGLPRHAGSTLKLRGPPEQELTERNGSHTNLHASVRVRAHQQQSPAARHIPMVSSHAESQATTAAACAHLDGARAPAILGSHALLGVHGSIVGCSCDPSLFLHQMTRLQAGDAA